MDFEIRAQGSGLRIQDTGGWARASRPALERDDLSCSLNFFKGDDTGEYYRVIKGDTRSLDNDSNNLSPEIEEGFSCWFLSIS